MRKLHVVIAGVVVVGAAYLGGMYVVGGKTLSRFHQVIDKINQHDSQGYYEIKNEHHGIFSSTAVVAGGDKKQSMTVEAPVVFHHGFFSTDIDSQIVATGNGQYASQSINSKEDPIFVHVHAKHNGQLPDIRVEAKQLNLPDVNHDGSIVVSGLKFDLTRENASSSMSRLALDVSDVNAEAKHYKGSVSLNVDQFAADTLASIGASTFRGSVDEKDLEAKVVAMLQKSPRFEIEKLVVSGDDLKEVSIDGYVTINGKDLKNIKDVQMHAQQLVKGQLIIRNVPELAVMMAPVIGLTDIKAGDTVTFDVDAGHVKANGNELF